MLSLVVRGLPALFACVLALRKQYSICWMRLRFPCHVYDVSFFYLLSEFAWILRYGSEFWPPLIFRVHVALYDLRNPSISFFAHRGCRSWRYRYSWPWLLATQVHESRLYTSQSFVPQILGLIFRKVRRGSFSSVYWDVSYERCWVALSVPWGV